MQDILDRIVLGTINRCELLEALMAHEEEVVNDYNAACEAIDEANKGIEYLKANAISRERDIVEIEKQALLAVDYARTLEAKNIVLKADNKEIKQLRNENKSLKKLKAKHLENAAKQTKRVDDQIKQARELRKDLAVAKSDVARLRLTGMKHVGDYAFTIFPTKTTNTVNNKVQKRVNLVIMDGKGNLKILGVDDRDNTIVQPKNHDFMLTPDQEEFILDFHRIATLDHHQYTDRVLAMVN